VFESQRQGADAGEDMAFVRATHGLNRLLAWVPARITALFFALAGSFDDAIRGWRELASSASEEFFDKNDQILVHVGRGALQLASSTEAASTASVEAVRGAMRLVQRALVIWLVLLSALTLVGWLA
jgi:AmpE protein